MGSVFNDMFTTLRKQLGAIMSDNRKILAKLEAIEEKNSEKLLIVKSKKPMRQIDLWTIREAINEQRPSGTIILPHDCEVVLVPKDIEIKIGEGENEH